MRKAMIYICWIGWCLLLGLSAFAQSENSEVEEVKPAIKVIARPLSDSIILRWAPTTPTAWEYANRYGYVVERVTLLRDQTVLEHPESIVLTPKPVKPLPLAEWESLANTNDYAAIAAQALYGETFELTENYASDIVQVVNKARELTSRFSFALFAADQSPTVAHASALHFTDTSARKNEKYVYRVYTPVPIAVLKIDTGYVYAGIADYQELPVPIELSAKFSDRSVQLHWNGELFQDIFTSYLVERSDDEGQTFQQINQVPFVNTSQKATASAYIYKSDTLPENDRKFVYRVRGVTPFGEISPPSEMVEGVGMMTLKANPAIVGAEVIHDQINIRWEFDTTYQQAITGFQLLRSGQAQGPFDIVVSPIAADQREVIDAQPQIANYYKITAIGKSGDNKSSFPFLAQLVDSIPPETPIGLTGIMDSSGVVTLHWIPNREEDLLGYRVYRSNFADHEYTQITVNPTQDTVFYDTLTVKTLTKKVYYKITAVDQHYNPSGFSIPLSLSRPDVIPPVSPVFSSVKSSEEGIALTWVNSSSKDVMNHLLYRRKTSDTSWRLIALFDPDDTVQLYLDEETSSTHYYEYTMIAVDSSHLESTPCTPVSAKRIDRRIRKEVKEFYALAQPAEKQIALSWNYKPEGVERFLLYRTQEDQPISLYTSLPADQQQFSDRKLTINTYYRYRIKAVYKDGSHSSFSKEIGVHY